MTTDSWDEAASGASQKRAMVDRRLEQIAYFPPALPNESPSSWMCRAALSQGVGIGEFTRFLGWKFSHQHDQDILFTRVFGADLARMPQLSGLRSAANLINAIASARTAMGFHFMYRQGRNGQRLPASRYCIECLDTAETPVFAQQWRLHDWRHCPTHNCLLEDACPHCSRAPRLPFSMAAENGLRSPVSAVKHCGHCRKALTALPAVKLQQAAKAGLNAMTLAAIEKAQEQISEVARTGGPCAHLLGTAFPWKPGVFGISLPQRRNILSAAEVRRLSHGPS